MRPGVLVGGVMSWPLSFVVVLLITHDLPYSIGLACVAVGIGMFLVNLGGK